MRKVSLLLGILLVVSSSYGQKKLKVGDVAPDIVAVSAQGNEISLNDYQGKKVLVAFFRFAGCPVCNFRMHELMENYEQLKAQNIEVVAIFESSNEMLNEYIEGMNFPFGLIGDPDKKLYKKYGVKKSMGKMMRTMFKKKPKKNMKKGKILFKGKKYKRDGALTMIPADILIDEDGKVLLPYYGRYVGDHLNISELLKY